ncbi:hypothetical protein BGX28_002804 [Mortierella sp. GBA30]|nr:hypothetical protein BGX28_002804 [Mortierella sp. GBA30]
MDFLKGAINTYQQTQQHGHDSESGEDRSNVDAHAGNVTPPKESDIHDAHNAHDKVYNQGNAEGASDDEIGKAAGVQAFKEYEKAEAQGSEGGERSEGGQSQLIQMAMAEAMKMFSGGKGQDKGAVVQSAIAMATKLFMGKSGSGGGGVAQLMAMLGGAGGKSGNGGESEGGSSGGMSNVMGMLENPQVAGMLKKFM